MARKDRRERLAWCEPFGRGGRVLPTLGRACALALVAFAWVSIPATLGRPVGVVSLVAGAVLAAIVVPVATLLLDRRRVAIDAAGVAIRSGGGLFPARTIAFAAIGRADVVREAGLGGRREYTLRLIAPDASGRARPLAALALPRADDPSGVAAFLTSRGLTSRFDDAEPAAPPFARTFLVTAALLCAIVWSARSAVVGAERQSVATFATGAPGIACVTARDGRLTIVVDGLNDVLDVRVGRATFRRDAVTVDRTEPDESRLDLRTGPLDPKTQRLVSVSRSLGGGGVESIGAPFDPASTAPQGARC